MLSRNSSIQNPYYGYHSRWDVQTNEEATVHVQDLELFVTAQIFEDTFAVLSLAKLCEHHGYLYEYASGHQKPHPAQNGKTVYRSLSQESQQVLPARVQVRLIHRYRRTRLMILHHVQQQDEVTAQAFRHRETSCAILRRRKTLLKIGRSFRHREAGCETCQSGHRSSKKI